MEKSKCKKCGKVSQEEIYVCKRIGAMSMKTAEEIREQQRDEAKYFDCLLRHCKTGEQQQDLLRDTRLPVLQEMWKNTLPSEAWGNSKDIAYRKKELNALPSYTREQLLERLLEWYRGFYELPPSLD